MLNPIIADRLTSVPGAGFAHPSTSAQGAQKACEEVTLRRSWSNGCAIFSLTHRASSARGRANDAGRCCIGVFPAVEKMSVVDLGGTV